jgi:hypothetical protein
MALGQQYVIRRVLDQPCGWTDTPYGLTKNGTLAVAAFPWPSSAKTNTR